MCSRTIQVDYYFIIQLNSADELNGPTTVVPQIQTRVPPTQQDPQFFNSVQEDAEQILKHEKIQEEYRKVVVFLFFFLLF